VEKVYDQIIRLKGIGPYTAAAICSMALDQPYAAIDGNLERVIARILALRENPKTLGYASVEKVANELVKLGRAGDVNQAFMDLSASYCLPKNPLCMLCPLARFCEAKKKNLCAEIPLKEKKPEPILLPSQGLILFHKEEILLAKRSPGNWLAGLWDIPWWTEKDIKPTLSSLILPRPYGKTKLKRSITKYQLDFQVSFYRLTKKPTKAMLQKSFGSVAQDWQWLPLANGQDMLPRPTQKALQSALKTLK
jgi:A/G-specific adenine glycosylase